MLGNSNNNNNSGVFPYYGIGTYGAWNVPYGLSYSIKSWIESLGQRFIYSEPNLRPVDGHGYATASQNTAPLVEESLSPDQTFSRDPAAASKRSSDR
jgi:hypothetical protein